MASAIPLRSDFDGAALRRLARASKDAGQTRVGQKNKLTRPRAPPADRYLPARIRNHRLDRPAGLRSHARRASGDRRRHLLRSLPYADQRHDRRHTRLRRSFAGPDLLPAYSVVIETGSGVAIHAIEFGYDGPITAGD